MGRPRLSTARICLDPMTSEHLPLLVKLDGDAEVLRYILGRARTAQEALDYWGPICSDIDADAVGLGWAGGWDGVPATGTSSAGGTSRQVGPCLGTRSKPRRDGGSPAGTGGGATPPGGPWLYLSTAVPPVVCARSGPRRWLSTSRADES